MVRQEDTSINCMDGVQKMDVAGISAVEDPRKSKGSCNWRQCRIIIYLVLTAAALTLVMRLGYMISDDSMAGCTQAELDVLMKGNRLKDAIDNDQAIASATAAIDTTRLSNDNQTLDSSDKTSASSPIARDPENTGNNESTTTRLLAKSSGELRFTSRSPVARTTSAPVRDPHNFMASLSNYEKHIDNGMAVQEKGKIITSVVDPSIGVKNLSQAISVKPNADCNHWLHQKEYQILWGCVMYGALVLLILVCSTIVALMCTPCYEDEPKSCLLPKWVVGAKENVSV